MIVSVSVEASKLERQAGARLRCVPPEINIFWA